MNANVNLQKSLTVLNNNTSYEAVQYSLTQNNYSTKIHREVPSNNIIGLEVPCSPLLSYETIELLKEAFGYKFNITYNNRESCILFTIKN